MSSIRSDDVNSFAYPLDPSLYELSEVARDFLHVAVSRDDGELRRRIYEVQKEAYEHCPYPCILIFHFVWLLMRQNPAYQSVLEAGKKGDTVFLDLGCCMGTDVRNLVHEGYPGANVVGCDLNQRFIDLGHKLYRDAVSCPILFLTSDVFDIPVSTPPHPLPTSGVPISKALKLSELANRVTHVHMGAIFHLFEEQMQYALALRIGLLLKREPGAVIFGRQQGSTKEEGLLEDNIWTKRYMHSTDSWRRLWTRVFTDLEGAEFTERHLLVDVEWEPLDVSVGTGRVQIDQMIWSVKIISGGKPAS